MKYEIVTINIFHLIVIIFLNNIRSMALKTSVITYRIRVLTQYLITLIA